MESEINPIELGDVLLDELRQIRGGDKTSDSPALENVFAELHKARMSALCFSGGGIRSATFGLGVMQSLAKHGLLTGFDYLSTVSGGGYLGSWFSAWIQREKNDFVEKTVINDPQRYAEYKNFKTGRVSKLSKAEVDGIDDDVMKFVSSQADLSRQGITEVQTKLSTSSIVGEKSPDPEPTQLQHLRKYSKYLTPKTGLLSADTWTFFGIYFRNLFLNWTIFIPLIAALLMAPRVLLALTRRGSPGDSSTIGLLGAGLVLAGLAIAFVMNKLPSKNRLNSDLKYDSDSWVLVLGIAPLLTLAFIATTLARWPRGRESALWANLKFLAPTVESDAIYFMIFAAMTCSMGFLLYFIWRLITKRAPKTNWSEIAALLLSSSIGGLILWKVAAYAADGGYNIAREEWREIVYVSVAVPILLLIFLVAATLFVGFSSKITTDDDREWLARFGSWILIICVGWIAINGLVLFGPIGLENVIEQLIHPSDHWIEYISSRLVPLIAVLSGGLSLAGGFSGKSTVKDESSAGYLTRFLAIAPRVAAVVFFGFIFVGIACLTSRLLPFVSEFLAGIPRLAGITNWGNFVEPGHLGILQGESLAFLLVCSFALFAIGLLMACCVNVNKFSLHGAYRDRLIRAYLGASNATRNGNPFTGFDESDNLQLQSLTGQRPLHLINATLNLIGGANLAWQDRKAASFTFSPLHCGSWTLGYRHSNEYSRNADIGECKHLRYCNQTPTCASIAKGECKLPGKSVRLGTAMAISGAAANPNMGYYSSPVVTFLMSLFNIRLGWWLGNTGVPGGKRDWFGFGTQYFTKPSPTVAVLPLMNETLGRTDESRRYINLSDGGHFENLAIYEMALRRCRLIVVSDAAADEDFTFGEISNAIQKCEVDLGVSIKFRDGIDIFSRKTAAEHKDRRKRYAIADIVYPEKRGNKPLTGHLVYLRPACYGTEPVDIVNYANRNAAFPHQSTADQFFDEKQFEAYRALGFYTMERLIGNQNPNDLDDFFDTLRTADKKSRE